MIDRWAEAFAEFQLKHGNIQQEDISVYRYGYTLMLEVIVNVGISIFLGIIFKSLKEVIFFLCMFIPLRSFSGGYHADKAWKCFILSNLAVAGVAVTSKLMILNAPLRLAENIIITIAALVIGALSPVDSQNRKLNISERKKYKHCTCIVIAAELLLEIVFYSMKMAVYYHIILMVYIIQFFSLAIDFLIRHFKEPTSDI